MQGFGNTRGGACASSELQRVACASWDKDGKTGNIDDSIIINNGDSQKVLSTVAATLYAFTEKFPEAMVFAIGNTKARTRLYRMGISNNIEAIKTDFEVFGLIKEEWQPFEKGVEYEAFLAKRKKH